MPQSRRNLLCALGIVLSAFVGMGGCPVMQPWYSDSDQASIELDRHPVDGVETNTVDIVADEGSTGAHLFQGNDSELTPPYTVQVTAGLPMPEQAAGFSPGFGGLELSVPGTSPLVFHGLYIQPAPTGTQVFFAYNNGGGASTGGTTFFNGANFMDLRIENDGTDVVFGARPLGDSVFQTLGTVPAPPGAFLNPGIGVFNFGDRERVSFFDVFVTESSAPQGATPADELADRITRDLLQPLVNAQGHLNGPNPDTSAASAIVNGLASSIPALLGFAQSLPAGTKEEEKFRDSVEKSILKINKTVLKLKKALDRGKAPDKLLKSLHKAILATTHLAGRLRY